MARSGKELPGRHGARTYAGVGGVGPPLCMFRKQTRLVANLVRGEATKVMQGRGVAGT